MSGAEAAVDRAFAGLAAMVLDCVHREYPTHVVHLARDERDIRPPRELTPAFWGSFDWHSAVHGHWALVRLLRRDLEAAWAARVEAALERSLTPENIAGECAYLAPPERRGFERPYGLAWLLQLGAELREWGDPRARRWSEILEPLEAIAFERMVEWVRKLRWPDRSGQHGQSAFALGLLIDACRTAGHPDTEEVGRRALAFYSKDENAPLGWEPGGHDFLSPILAEADVVRRELATPAFGFWLGNLLGDPDRPEFARWLTPVATPDRADGKFAHLDGLNFSRAWMLEAVSCHLREDSPLAEPLASAAARHAAAGLAALPAEHYAGAHWLGSFAVYLVTQRWIRPLIVGDPGLPIA